MSANHVPVAVSLRAIVFIDGQNLFFAARDAFGYTESNYDPCKLADAVCAIRNWHLDGIYFYTGVPDLGRHPRQHAFWTAKLRGLRRKKVAVFSPTLRYRYKRIRFDERSSFHLPTGDSVPRGTELFLNDGSKLPFGSELSAEVGEEKGVDVRLAVDLLRLAVDQAYDIAVIFSQDQDLAEAAREVRAIAVAQKRTVHLYSAFPVSPRRVAVMPITNTQSILIDRAAYDACLDRTNYWPRR
jgi:uncharacterized LabA/DUF88 family protein